MLQEQARQLVQLSKQSGIPLTLDQLRDILIPANREKLPDTFTLVSTATVRSGSGGGKRKKKGLNTAQLAEAQQFYQLVKRGLVTMDSLELKYQELLRQYIAEKKEQGLELSL
jgi:hypothetical protein